MNTTIMLAMCLMSMNKLEKVEALVLPAYELSAAQGPAAANQRARFAEILARVYEKLGNDGEARRYRDIDKGQTGAPR